ncbi:MAG TPA: DNA repair protein RecN [Bryobacteraceae bacterium]|nr:DNA repair protein RecN [Bryobacteraceae bacterium]
MLLELVVENYAVVERVRVRFHPGLNLLTGETGSGKSIIVDALALLFGGRTSADAIRTGAPRARISGLFEAPRDRRFNLALEQAGIEVEDGELLLEREISAEGKSRAFVGSRPVTAALLRELAPWLGDIHGQHDQQLLFSAEAQLDLLDAFAGGQEARDEVARVYSRWRAVDREAEELERGEQEKLRMLDLWTFQRKEIESVSPKRGEDAALEQERRVLQNCARLQEAANAAYSALYDSPESAVTQLRVSLRRLDELCRIDPRLEPAREALGPAAVAVEEASYAVRDYVADLEADPARLEEVETRLSALDRLKRKYGASCDDMLAFLEDVRERIAAVETADARKAELERERQALAAEYECAARILTERRTQAARKLEKRVEAELAALAMGGTAFQIEMSPAPWSEQGADAVRFLVSPNAGEEARPIEKVASGGEISRIALALKTCIAGAAVPRRGVVRTLVFDEVDAGIGGRAAETVGRRLKQLAAANQLLCVTHLPQIAGFADHHFRVEKKERDGRTAAAVGELTPEERMQEIGRMLSGERVTREALKQAEQLIKSGAE